MEALNSILVEIADGVVFHQIIISPYHNIITSSPQITNLRAAPKHNQSDPDPPIPTFWASDHRQSSLHPTRILGIVVRPLSAMHRPRIL